jgi:hypothetical protein
VLVLVLALACCALALACGERDRSRHVPRGARAGASVEGSASAEAPAPAADRAAGEEGASSEPPPSTAWPTEVESLRDALAVFDTVEGCRATLRARTPTSVAEGIADFAYEGFFDDVCASMGAVREGSIEGCDALAISTARAGCRRRLALVHARPEACPADRVTLGREPVCVAWASRDPGLCRASDAEALCRAVLARDARRCAPLAAGDRSRCEALVRRYGPSIEDPARESARETPRFALELRRAGDPPLRIERDVLARGVRLEPRGCAWALVLANPRGEPSLASALGVESDRFTLELLVPASARAPLSLPLAHDSAELSVVTHAYGPLSSRAAASGDVQLERFEARRGAPIEGRIEGSLRHGNERISVRGELATFVRDLDPLPAECTPAP